MASRIRIDPARPSPHKLQPVTAALLAGDVIAYPTDMGYAFACPISSHRGVTLLRKLKGIGSKEKKPLTILVDSLPTMSHYGIMSNQAFRVIRRLLPGPYTIILPASSELPRSLRNRNNEVGLHLADEPISKILLEAINEPMFTASVRSADDEPELEEPEFLERFYGQGLCCIVDVGPLWPEPSTILRLHDDEIEVIRMGKGALPD